MAQPHDPLSASHQQSVAVSAEHDPSVSPDERLQETVSVAGVAARNGRFLLGRRKPGGSQGGRWEFIGGKVGVRERPAHALVREFMEELRVSIEVGPLFYRGSFRNKDVHFTLQVYQVTLLDEEMLLSEHDEVGWFTVDEMLDMELSDSDYGVVEYLQFHDQDEWV